MLPLEAADQPGGEHQQCAGDTLDGMGTWADQHGVAAEAQAVAVAAKQLQPGHSLPRPDLAQTRRSGTTHWRRTGPQSNSARPMYPAIAPPLPPRRGA